MKRVTAAVLMLLGSAGVLLAGSPVPEIDPSGAPAALALLGGALLVLRDRRRG